MILKNEILRLRRCMSQLVEECSIESVGKVFSELDIAVNNLSAIQEEIETSQDGWIYCGDGNNLPTEDGHYYVTLDLEELPTQVLAYSAHSKTFLGYKGGILAWRPLPKKYVCKSAEFVNETYSIYSPVRCPKCGNTVRIGTRTFESGDKEYYVMCNSAIDCGFFVGCYPTRDAAIDAWNKEVQARKESRR